MKTVEEHNFIQIPNFVADYWLSVLTPSEFKVLFCIYRHISKDDKASCRLSYDEMRRATGLTKRTMIRAVEQLIKHSLINKTPHKDERGRQCNEYKFCMPILGGTA